jgi:hypothetical protein
VACRASRDANGTTYFVPQASVGRDPSGRVLAGLPEVQVWWARRFKDLKDETLIIRQESNEDKADVIELTLGQVYDLIHALGAAVMRS